MNNLYCEHAPLLSNLIFNTPLVSICTSASNISDPCVPGTPPYFSIWTSLITDYRHNCLFSFLFWCKKYFYRWRVAPTPAIWLTSLSHLLQRLIKHLLLKLFGWIWCFGANEKFLLPRDGYPCTDSFEQLAMNSLFRIPNFVFVKVPGWRFPQWERLRWEVRKIMSSYNNN